MVKTKQNLVVITGAGMSAESGLSTFRDGSGLWNNHKIQDVATPQAWAKNPTLVLDFYNQRRAQLFDVEPNRGHIVLAELEQNFKVQIITQNVDDLHERAGSKSVMHLHGELRKIRSTGSTAPSIPWTKDLTLGQKCENGHQLRPDIVWFGEPVPLMEDAIMHMAIADYVLIVGSSMQVYPAASLVHYAPSDAICFYVDPNPAINPELMARQKLEIIKEPGTIGVPFVAEILKRLLQEQ